MFHQDACIWMENCQYDTTSSCVFNEKKMSIIGWLIPHASLVLNHQQVSQVCQKSLLCCPVSSLVGFSHITSHPNRPRAKTRLKALANYTQNCKDFSKKVGEIIVAHIKNWKKSLQLWKKVLVCMEDNCIFCSFVGVCEGLYTGSYLTNSKYRHCNY